MNDEVRLVIDGKEFAGWTGCTLDMAIDHIADSFAVEGPWDPDRKELRAACRPFGNQRVQVYIDDDLYLTGKIDKQHPTVAENERKIVIEGRSMTGPLSDCSIRGDLEFSGLTLAAIARRICKSYGIEVRADSDTVSISEARAEYGQKAADFLNSLAAARNILLNCSYDGKLVLTAGSTLIRKMPVSRFLEGESAVKSVDAVYDATKRFSYYEVASQFAGVPDIVGSCTDSSIVSYRPLLVAAGEADSDPGKTAARLRAQALAESVSVSVTVTGWRRPEGKRWAERQIVTLLAPSAMIFKEVPWLVAGAKFKLDVSSGRTTEIHLVLPETYSGTMPKDLPWVS